MIEVFFSYAHEDENLRDDLAKQLKLLEKQGIISAWYDRQIVAGSEWGKAIDAHLNSAQVILLLISPDFLASDYCFDIEVTRSMERHQAGEAIVMPIILRPVDYWQKAPFGRLQALPTNAKPVTMWENRDEAFQIVAQGIRKAIEKLNSVQELEKTSASNGGDIYRTLLRLGYRSQVRLFRRLTETESVAAFLIHGLPDYGQRWLLNRLVVQYVPHFLNGKVVMVNVSRKVRRNDVSALWREVAGRVGLRGKIYTPSEIAEQVCQCLQTQNVLLVFHEVESMPETTLSELIDNFWLPLVSKVHEQPSPASKFKLLMFLIDYEGCVESWEVPFTEKLNSNWHPHSPVRPPIIAEFSNDDLTDWMETEYDNLPTVLTNQVDNMVQMILANSDNGVPELVLETICTGCGYDWYQESEKWMKL
jgi:inactive STAND/TIR domain